MKSLPSITAVLTFITVLFTSRYAAAQDSLSYYNNQRVNIKSTGMKILGGWAVANIGAGTIGYYHASGSARSFHQMNIIWNVANLGIATAGYLTNLKDRNKTLSADESLKEQQKTERLFLINGALDLGYIGTGIYLKNRGDRKSSDQLKGYGTSVMLQGAFLLLFDSLMYTTERQNGDRLRRFLAKNPVTFNGREAGILITLN